EARTTRVAARSVERGPEGGPSGIARHYERTRASCLSRRAQARGVEGRRWARVRLAIRSATGHPRGMSNASSSPAASSGSGSERSEVTLTTPFYPGAKKILLLGSGELGREVALEAMRLGVEVVACDRYEHAPAMQFAQRAHVLDMLDPTQIRRVVALERPADGRLGELLIVPEIEAIATNTLLELEAEGYTVIPTARATRLTMDRQGIRSLAAEELGLPVGGYRFAESLAELKSAVSELGLPCVVKPVMSSS